MKMKMAGIVRSCLVLSLLLVAASAVPVDTAVSYEGYQVVRIIPANDDEVRIVQSIIEDPTYSDVDIWLEPSHGGKPVDINVPPSKYQTLIETLKSGRLAYTVMIDDVQEEIDQENSRLDEDRRFKRQQPDIVGAYVNYGDMVAWANNLASSNTKVTVQSYGKSVENRDLTVIKIAKASGTKKPIVFIEAGIHAREWISPATAIWMINLLATSTDTEVTNLLDAADWHIVPVTNPDGYEYTRGSDRLWRKNRAVNAGTTCRGVDLNRNWDSHWMSVGASNKPCDETYAGSAAFSEPETKALRDYLLGVKSDIKAYIGLHSYSQLWLTPWAWTSSPPADNAVLMSIANQGASALTAVYGTAYTVGSPALILYAAAGGSYDWVKEKAGVQFAYTLELRDTGRNGFLLPVNQILPTAIETWAGIKTAMKLILNR